jgi:hypothetical protein
MAEFLTAVWMLSWLALVVTNVFLVVAAWQTSAKLGVLTLIVPFYAVSTGNWRLKTEKRALLARRWWTCLALLLVSSMIPR